MKNIILIEYNDGKTNQIKLKKDPEALYSNIVENLKAKGLVRLEQDDKNYFLDCRNIFCISLTSNRILNKKLAK